MPPRRRLPRRGRVVVVALLFGTAGIKPAAARRRSTAGGATAEADRRRAHGPARVRYRLMVAGNSVAWYLAREGSGPPVGSHDVALFNAANPRVRLSPGDAGQDALGRDRRQAALVRRLLEDGHRALQSPMPWSSPSPTTAQVGSSTTAASCSRARPGSTDWMRTDLTGKVRFFRSQGARVVLVTSLYAGANFLIKETPIVRRMTDCANQVERDVARLVPGTTVYDLNGRLCRRDGPCQEQIGDIVVRPDGLHFRHRSAELVASWLYPLIMSGRTRPGLSRRPG